MATPARWTQGPFASLWSVPSQQSMTPQEMYQAYSNQILTNNPPIPTDPNGPNYGGMTSAEYGQMTPGERSTLGGIATGMGLAGRGLAAAGVPGGLGVLGASIRGALGLDSLLSAYAPSFMGLRGIRDMTQMEQQDENDKWGIGQRVAQAPVSRLDPAEFDLTGYADYGSSQGGPGGVGISAGPGEMGVVGMSTGPTPGGYDDGEGQVSGYGNGGNGPGGSTDNGRGSSDVGSDAAGQGGAWAKGGVAKVKKPTTALFGEAGEETGIFVPRSMEKPGLQVNEKSVRGALKQASRKLMPKGRK